MSHRLGLLPVALAALVAAGCLQKETAHTLYLSPDGSMKWVAVESEVYSDETDPGARFTEEQRYIGAALVGTHPVALGLKELNPSTIVETTVLRDERPFHVVTKAGFARADRALERLFVESGVAASVRLTSDGRRSTLRFEFDFSRDLAERESPVTVLLEELEDFTFVLTEGAFIAGGGFEVRDRAGRARISGDWLKLADEAVEGKRKIELVLAWE